MTTDINSLDDVTRDKIKTIQQRCSELANGQEITVNLPIKIKYGWYDGNRGIVHEWGNNLKHEIDWEIVKQNEKEIQQKLDAEIKEIVDFSNSVADRFGVDLQSIIS